MFSSTASCDPCPAGLLPPTRPLRWFGYEPSLVRGGVQRRDPVRASNWPNKAVQLVMALRWSPSLEGGS